MTATLPPLPDADYWSTRDDDTPLYTTDQLRAYGAACAAAEREACANLLDLIAADYGTKHLMFEQNAADYCAGAIRARKDAA